MFHDKGLPTFARNDKQQAPVSGDYFFRLRRRFPAPYFFGKHIALTDS